MCTIRRKANESGAAGWSAPQRGRSNVPGLLGLNYRILRPCCQAASEQKANSGAGSRVRTDDLLITNQLLYQLSYAGFCLAGGRLVAIQPLLNRILRDSLTRYPAREWSLRIRSIPGNLRHESASRLDCQLLGLHPPSRSRPD